MRISKLIVTVLVSAFVCTTASPGDDGSFRRMYGKHARMREITGMVIGTGTSWWGARYVVVKDASTGLRVYVQFAAEACAPGTQFKASGHLTRATGKDYDASFHIHLSDAGTICG